MAKLLEEIRQDVKFVKSHTLQPGWYKILKVFILVGFLIGYYAWFGIMETLIFFASFIFLSFLVHMLYRVKTNKWQRSWLDFVVVEENHELKATSIGVFYYSAIVINALISLVISRFAFG